MDKDDWTLEGLIDAKIVLPCETQDGASTTDWYVPETHLVEIIPKDNVDLQEYELQEWVRLLSVYKYFEEEGYSARTHEFDWYAKEISIRVFTVVKLEWPLK